MGLLSADWKLMVPLNCEICPMWVELDQRRVEASWLGGTNAFVLVDGAGSCLSEEKCLVSSSIFWDVYGLGMALGNLSANGAR